MAKKREKKAAGEPDKQKEPSEPKIKEVGQLKPGETKPAEEPTPESRPAETIPTKKHSKLPIIIGAVAVVILVVFGLAVLIDYSQSISYAPANTCRQVQEPYSMQVPYTEKEPYTTTETYYETETYDIPKETQWKVDWYTITGAGQWGATIGSRTLPATFFQDWKGGVVFDNYGDYVGFIATAEINVPVSGLVHFQIGSDDGARLWVDEVEVVSTWGSHKYYTSFNKITLEKGKHSLKLQYYEYTGDAAVLFDTNNREILSWTEQGQRQVQKTRELVKYRDVTKYKTEMQYRTATRCD